MYVYHYSGMMITNQAEKIGFDGVLVSALSDNKCRNIQ
jgi:hypothetical protein